MKDRIYSLEEERKELLGRMGYDLTAQKGSLSESSRSAYPAHEKSMVDIQSFMKEIGNLIENKKEDTDKRRKNYDQLRHSVAYLE